MAILARLITLLPLALSIVSCILAALALFSGHKQGFMEDYAIARLNTSMIGHNVFDFDDDGNRTNGDDDDSGFLDSIGDDIADAWDKAKDKIEDELNKITGDIADQLADTLGVSEWYSLHIMDACEGQYKPNATAHHPGLNVTDCTKAAPNHRLNLTDMLDHELQLGPFDITLADLNWPDSIQDKIDILNDALLALFILYVLGIGFSGLGALTSIVSFLFAEKRSLVLLNFILALLAALSLTIGSIIVTVAVTKGIRELNKVGEDFGVKATKGTKFLVISWIAAGFMIVAAAVWTVQFCVVWRKRKVTRRHNKEVY